MKPEGKRVKIDNVTQSRDTLALMATSPPLPQSLRRYASGDRNIHGARDSSERDRGDNTSVGDTNPSRSKSCTPPPGCRIYPRFIDRCQQSTMDQQICNLETKRVVRYVQWTATMARVQFFTQSRCNMISYQFFFLPDTTRVNLARPTPEEASSRSTLWTRSSAGPSEFRPSRYQQKSFL